MLDPGDIFECPACRAPMPGPAHWKGEQYRCACARAWPCVRGIPRFVGSEEYTQSFGFQWTVHRTTQLDDATSRESEETLTTKTGLSPDQVAGKLILDAGCGMGRFSEVLSRWGARVVGVDLSSACESAHANLHDRSNVLIAQADIGKLPFRPASFDVVMSLGVLHHTPDTYASFQKLVPLVKPGGLLAIWVYVTTGADQAFIDLYRIVTTRLPGKLLYGLCHLAVPLYYLQVMPVIGKALHAVMPVSLHSKASWRVLDTFDRYAPRYRWTHTVPEVKSWFEAEGMVDVERLAFLVSVRGRKPTR